MKLMGIYNLLIYHKTRQKQNKYTIKNYIDKISEKNSFVNNFVKYFYSF